MNAHLYTIFIIIILNTFLRQHSTGLTFSCLAAYLEVVFVTSTGADWLPSPMNSNPADLFSGFIITVRIRMLPVK